MTVSNPFNAEATPSVPFADPNAVSMDDLIGEDKKYKTPEDLVKALAHSQNHIATLEGTMKELRDDLNSRLKIEDALKQLSSNNADNGENPATPARGSEVPRQEEVTKEADSITLEDVERLLSVKGQEAQKEKNMAAVTSRLEAYTGGGQQAAEFIQAKAKELGMSVADLQAQAEANPKVFFKLVDIGDAQGRAPTGALQTYTAPNTTRAPDPNRLETTADFDELRRLHPTKYFSPKVQRELMKVRMKELENRN